MKEDFILGRFEQCFEGNLEQIKTGLNKNGGVKKQPNMEAHRQAERNIQKHTQTIGDRNEDGSAKIVIAFE